MVIQVDGREVALTCIHVGVDLLRVNEILNNKVRMYCIVFFYRCVCELYNGLMLGSNCFLFYECHLLKLIITQSS